MNPPQRRLQIDCAVVPTEAQLRAAFERTHLPMSFWRAMAAPAVQRCLVAAARARLAACAEKRGRR